MTEQDLLNLRGKLRGAQYGVDSIRRAVMDTIFEAKGLRGEELFNRVTQIDDLLESLETCVSEVKSKVDEEIRNLPAE